jgi:hypothetical protein
MQKKLDSKFPAIQEFCSNGFNSREMPWCAPLQEQNALLDCFGFEHAKVIQSQPKPDSSYRLQAEVGDNGQSFSLLQLTHIGTPL